MKIIFPFILLFNMFVSGCALHTTSSERSQLDDMIGQMVMVGFRGLEAGPDSLIAKDIRGGGIGGVILFSKDCALNSTVRNISDYSQLKKMTSTLQGYSRETLFIAVDQEGGL